jgi:hypothetical protein
MVNRSLVPKPWWQVGLTILPGLVLLLGQVFSPSSAVSAGLRFLILAVMLLLIVSSVLRAVKRASLLQVPVWGFIPLGVLAGVGLMVLPYPLGFYVSCFLMAVTGLVFARHNGMSAGLFVLPGGMLAASWAIEPGMYLRDSPFQRIVLGAGMIVLFWFLSPILVLRSRSVLGQAMGLYFPMATYAAAFVFALSSANGLAQPWFQLSLGQSMSVARPFLTLFATVAVAAPIYAWIAQRARHTDQALAVI